jgi:hypothetical protein
MSMRSQYAAFACFFLLAFTLAVPAVSYSQTTAAGDPNSIPIVDGGLGSCSADFTVTDGAGAPVYAAKIRVHIAYRFMNLHKLDLEVSTNSQGKARFIGIPQNLKHGLYFYASEGDREGEVFDDPAVTCKAQFAVILDKKKS